jgi:hypothetical protein
VAPVRVQRCGVHKLRNLERKAPKCTGAITVGRPRIRGKKCGQPLGREIMMSDDMDETLFEASVRVARARPQACPPPRTRRRSLSPDQTRCPDLSIEVDDIEVAFRKVREAGLPLEYGPRANLGACAVSTFEIYWASSST